MLTMKQVKLMVFYTVGSVMNSNRDCSKEIRKLRFWTVALKEIEKILKCRNVSLNTRPNSWIMIFPNIMDRCESGAGKKADGIDLKYSINLDSFTDAMDNKKDQNKVCFRLNQDWTFPRSKSDKIEVIALNRSFHMSWEDNNHWRRKECWKNMKTIGNEEEVLLNQRSEGLEFSKINRDVNNRTSGSS